MKKNINNVTIKNKLTVKKKIPKKKGEQFLVDGQLLDYDRHAKSDFDTFLRHHEVKKNTIKVAKSNRKRGIEEEEYLLDDVDHLGSDFDTFLHQQEMAQEVNLAAIKKIISYEIQKEMAQKKITQTAMADRLGTSRAGLQRLLDPDNYSITLHTLNKVSYILGKRFDIVFHDL